MTNIVPGSTSRSVFILVALLVGIFATAGLAVVRLHRQTHQLARERVDLEKSLTRLEASILDFRGRLEQVKSTALAEERRADPATRGLLPVRPDRVARIPGGRSEISSVAFAPVAPR